MQANNKNSMIISMTDEDYKKYQDGERDIVEKINRGIQLGKMFIVVPSGWTCTFSRASFSSWLRNQPIINVTFKNRDNDKSVEFTAQIEPGIFTIDGKGIKMDACQSNDNDQRSLSSCITM
jgi:hypothetical protein